MKIRIFSLIVILYFSVSCREEAVHRGGCSVESPVKELAWLAKEIDGWENSEWGRYAYVTQAEYEGQTIFIIGNCCPFCDSIWPVYNCAGERIGIVGREFDESVLDTDVVIWKSADSDCTV